MIFEATYCGLLRVPEPSADEFDRDEIIEAAVERIGEELLRLRLIDPILSGSIAKGLIEVTVSVENDDATKAFIEIDSSVRTAFHAAEVATPNWPMVTIDSVNFQKLTPASSEELADA